MHYGLFSDSYTKTRGFKRRPKGKCAFANKKYDDVKGGTQTSGSFNCYFKKRTI